MMLRLNLMKTIQISVVNSIDFHKKGEMLASSDNNGVLNLYNANMGEYVPFSCFTVATSKLPMSCCIHRLMKTVHSKDYGCRALTYTHHDLAVLFAATTDSKMPSMCIVYDDFA